MIRLTILVNTANYIFVVQNCDQFQSISPRSSQGPSLIVLDFQSTKPKLNIALFIQNSSISSTLTTVGVPSTCEISYWDPKGETQAFFMIFIQRQLWQFDKLPPCSATCGQSIEIWVRYSDNPPEKYGGNCSKQGADHENRLCAKKPCQDKIVRVGTGFHVTSNGIAIELCVLIYFSCLPPQDDWFHRCSNLCDRCGNLKFFFIRRKRCGKRGEISVQSSYQNFMYFTNSVMIISRVMTFKTQ